MNRDFWKGKMELGIEKGKLVNLGGCKEKRFGQQALRERGWRLSLGSSEVEWGEEEEDWVVFLQAEG